MHYTPVVLKGPRPWAFTKAELTAGMRRRLSDSSLLITELKEINMKSSRPATGRIRGVQVVYQGSSGTEVLEMAAKEPHNTTRSGTAGAGRREAAFYQNLADQVPFDTPKLWAADKGGKWMVMDLLSPFRLPEYWGKSDYLLAVDMLVQLHYRFLGLGDDLTAYPWLSRPLTSDKQVHLKAAANSVKRIVEGKAASQLSRDKGLALDLEKLVRNGKKIAAYLMKEKATLLHGDYWPGNLCLTGEGSLAGFDWQQAGVGPGILDLVSLVQNSRWWFSPLPWQMGEIHERYRRSFEKCSECSWDAGAWEELWDYGLMWKFLTEWAPLLAEIPEPVLDTRFHLLRDTWLEPVRKAVVKRL